jgi:hypothetical protein
MNKSNQKQTRKSHRHRKDGMILETRIREAAALKTKASPNSMVSYIKNVCSKS